MFLIKVKYDFAIGWQTLSVKWPIPAYVNKPDSLPLISANSFDLGVCFIVGQLTENSRQLEVIQRHLQGQIRQRRKCELYGKKSLDINASHS